MAPAPPILKDTEAHDITHLHASWGFQVLLEKMVSFGIFLNASQLRGSVMTFGTFSPDVLSKVLFLKAQTTGLGGFEEACVLTC